MNYSGEEVLRAIDKHLEDSQESGNRAHLGASVIGRPCERELWYSFHWATTVTHEGRMVRLFNRGHLEEFRFEDWIKPICDNFWPLDPRTGEQIRIKDHEGHFGGSLDGVVRNLKLLTTVYTGDFLTEFKTHNTNSFEKLGEVGVKKAKWEHYVQMQIYLKKHPKLIGAWYFAICKNDDHMHIEFVPRDETVADEYLDRAARILMAEHPDQVKRVKGATANPDAKWNWQINSFNPCRFCDHRDLCWGEGRVKPAMNCRTCAFSELAEDGKFYCNKHNRTLDVAAQREGCEDYERLF